MWFEIVAFILLIIYYLYDNFSCRALKMIDYEKKYLRKDRIRYSFLKTGLSELEQFTFKDFIDISKHGGHGFTEAMTRALNDSSAALDAFFWECPPIQGDNLSRPFEFVTVKAPGLSSIRQDFSSFSDKFNGQKSIYSFPNLNGDAILVTPSPDPEKDYAHLGEFNKNGDHSTKMKLWVDVAENFGKALQDGKPKWLSTNGLGVFYVHIRIDKSPKYYQHEPYKTTDSTGQFQYSGNAKRDFFSNIKSDYIKYPSGKRHSVLYLPLRIFRSEVQNLGLHHIRYYNMGKTDFPGIYRKIKLDHGNITCKISYFSDAFNPNNDYVGVIIYGMSGKTSWRNFSGQAAGYNGKSFYVIIKKTDPYPDKSDVGNGLYHSYPLEQVLGSHIDNNQVLGGGFAYHQGTLKYSSPRLNQSDKQMGLNGSPSGSDGTKYLSAKEQILVRFCWDQYVQKGPHAIFEIPPNVEQDILEGGTHQSDHWTRHNDSRDQMKIQNCRDNNNNNNNNNSSGDNSS